MKIEENDEMFKKINAIIVLGISPFFYLAIVDNNFRLLIIEFIFAVIVLSLINLYFLIKKGDFKL